MTHSLRRFIPAFCHCCMEVKGVVEQQTIEEHAILPEMCGSCKDYTKKGVIFIKVSNDLEKPTRTGAWCVVEQSKIDEMNQNMVEADHIGVDKRMYLIPEEIWDGMGLPNEDYSNE